MPRRRQRPIDILTPKEVLALLSTASSQAPSGIRNRALIALLYYSGVRLSEALALEPYDLDLEAGEINVRRGKGGRRGWRSVCFRAAWIGGKRQQKTDIGQYLAP